MVQISENYNVTVSYDWVYSLTQFVVKGDVYSEILFLEGMQIRIKNAG
jgi:hypothetical protein